MCSDLGVGLQSVVYDIAKVASQVMGSCYLMKVKEACWMIPFRLESVCMLGVDTVNSSGYSLRKLDLFCPH